MDLLDGTQPTQPTQPMTAEPPRPHRTSFFSDADLSNVIVAFFPLSDTARTAVRNLIGRQEQHILQTEKITTVWDESTTDVERVVDASAPHPVPPSDNGRLSTPKLPAPVSRKLGPIDIAWRFDSKLVSPKDGLQWGRSLQSCDIVLGEGDDIRRVSSVHFRVYLSDHGIPMLEDRSTNGTFVDGELLRADQHGRHIMLRTGQIITVIQGQKADDDEFKFIVRIPERGNWLTSYESRLDQYREDLDTHPELLQCRTHQAELSKIGTGITPPVEPPTPRARRNMTPPKRTRQLMINKKPEWDGAPKYNIISDCGKGAFSVVKRIATRNGGILYAAKQMEKKQIVGSVTKNIRDQIGKEIEILKKTRHRNIVRYEECVEFGDYIYIIMEYLPGGDLRNCLDGDGRMPEPVVQDITYQVLQGVEHLHQQHITHRDIKPDNILIASLDPIQVKLSDFGLSKITTGTKVLTTFCGTLHYLAPEVFPEYSKWGHGQKRTRQSDGQRFTSSYGQSVDIWSIGVVVFSILSGSGPYDGENERELLVSIMSAPLSIGPLVEAEVSPEAVDFVQKALDRRPENRPSVTACLGDVWLRDVAQQQAQQRLIEPNELHEEDEQQDLDASQLSLYEPQDEESPNTEAGDLKRSKRPRQHGRFLSISVTQDSIDPSQETTASMQEMLNAAPSIGPQSTASKTGGLLFGEVTVSQIPTVRTPAESSYSSVEQEDAGGPSFISINSESHESASTAVPLGHPQTITLPIRSTPDQTQSSQSTVLEKAQDLQYPQVDRKSSSPGPPADALGIGSANDSKAKAAFRPAVPSSRPSFDASRRHSGSVQSGRSAMNRRIRYDLLGLSAPAGSEEHALFGSTLSRPLAVDSGVVLPESNTSSWVRPSVQGSLRDREQAGFLSPQKDASVLDQTPAGGDSTNQVSSPHTRSGVSSLRNETRPEMWGRLVSIPGSAAPDLVIPLEHVLIKLDRSSLRTLLPRPADDGVEPILATIGFYEPFVKSRPFLRAHKNWRDVPSMTPVITAPSPRGIYINGVKFASSTGAWGRLFHGDELVILKQDGAFVGFRCEIFYGAGRAKRPPELAGFCTFDAPHRRRHRLSSAVAVG